jgi:biopolymer transport protein ExbD
MRRIVRLSFGALLAASAAAQAPALRKGVSVQMPVTMNAVEMRDADLADSVVVAVTSRGTVYMNITTATPAQLSEQVKAELGGHPGKRIYVKADARTAYTAVAEVLSALRRAGVNAPLLLTSQHEATKNTYAPPMGLEVLIPPPTPDAAHSVTLRIGGGQPSDAEMRQSAQRDRAVVLQADDRAPFGDVVHAVDVCRAAGAQVYLATPGK